jgi:hypothetical protein
MDFARLHHPVQPLAGVVWGHGVMYFDIWLFLIGSRRQDSAVMLTLTSERGRGRELTTQ